jgi:hypothetical protein
MTTQFARLENDILELETYIKKLQKRKVDSGLISKLIKKKEFLTNHITEKKMLVQ